MLRLALKMTWARKGRLVLTSLAIILGTGFLSGTFVFRDTINQTFDRLFSDVFRDVDAYVRSTAFIELDFGGEQRAGTPISALETVRNVEGVVSATGDIQGFARVIGKDGKPLGSEGGGPPTFGSIASDDSAGLWSVVEGRLPNGPKDVMLDRATADNGEFIIGDTVRVIAARGAREFTLVGIASYGDISSPGGATFALFDQPTASEFLLEPGFVDAFLIEGDDSVSDEVLAQRIDAALADELKLETLTGAEITAVFAAWLPARRAGRVPPLAALRDTALDTAGNLKRRVIIGLVLIALGVVGLIAASNDAPIQVLGLGVLGVFAGILVLGPAIARPVALALGKPVAALRGVSGTMARQNAARNPKRTSRTAAPVLLGVALVTAFTALAASIRSEIRDTFGAAFSGDFALTVDSQGFGGIPLSVTDQIAGLDGVAQATGVGFTSVRIVDPNDTTVDPASMMRGNFVQTINPATIVGLFDLGVTEGDLSSLGRDGLFVDAGRATERGWQVGTRLQVIRIDGAVIDAEVRGLVSGETSFANYVASREMFADAPTPIFDSFVYIKAAQGAALDEVEARIAAISSDAGIGTLQSKEGFIDAQAAQVNQVLGLIYGLLGLSIIIAIVGIVITLLLSVFERRREIGLLRAVGMTRAQVRTTVRWESVITSLLGAVTGVVLGIVMGVVVVAALADDGDGITFRLPVTGTLVIVVISFILGVVAAIYPAWRATKVNVVEAISTT
ncbi:MAG: FtsX-like permease family protein [Actinobacteria bacterium]|nr:FtsX-like permease family protein [Actinomycetota bacterium]